MNLTTQNLDHLGLVAGMCDEIGISEIIDRACGTQAKNKNLSFGQCVKCMILNGLGFVGRTLYMYSEYFEDKPVEHLIGVPIQPEKIDDNVLGRTLDKLFSLGVSGLFTQIALQAMKVLGIDVKSLHLDSTSFHVDGAYQSLIEQDESRIQLVQGYSRDHRPELNQAILHLITSNQGNIPLFMQAASGNTADKAAFAEIVSQHAKSFREAVQNRYIVGDSALYTPTSIQALDASETFFVSRVPSQIKATNTHICASYRANMTQIGERYFGCEYDETYADVAQRWVVVFSEAAHARECKTLVKRYTKKSEQETKDFQQLMRQTFTCREDAFKHLKKTTSRYKYINIENIEIVEVERYSSVGRPKRDSRPAVVGYQLRGSACCSLIDKRSAEERKGYFVLATNDLDPSFTMSDVLATYKSQQSVERGFRFLKSPDFLVSSFFLKKPERIESLLMVMTLCLLVYAGLEHKVRQQLREKDEYFLNQKKKPSQNPTTRWVFFCFLGLHMVYVDGKKQQVTNLKQRHKTILYCLGPLYRRLYYSEMW